ncbi:MAG: molybdopterin molybdotransferase MoeA [Acidimicrobiales bacterium]
MIPLAEARAYVLDCVAPLEPVRYPVADAEGCVIAEEVRATEAIPPFANTAVDGFAVRAADTAGATPEEPVRLAVVDTLPAGAAPDRAVYAGEAIRIMTGAPIPAGADAVVMVEHTSDLDGGATVLIEVEAASGDAVRPAGDDVEAEDKVLDSGTALTPGHLGVLTSLGRTDVLVHPRSRVGVLSTGRELVEGDQPLRPGQIRDSNRPTLLALVAGADCVPVDLGLVPDDEDTIAAAVERGVRECDAICTSGGVSMGEYDYVKAVLDKLGDMRWMQVAIRPAKPFAFGRVTASERSVPVFGLPGNPVSSIVSFELFARPALRRMMGHPDATLDRPRVKAVADEPLRRRADGKTHFARVIARYGPDGRVHVRSAGGQGSHQLTAMAVANALAIQNDGDGTAPGGEVDVMLVGEVRAVGGGTTTTFGVA